MGRTARSAVAAMAALALLAVLAAACRPPESDPSAVQVPRETPAPQPSGVPTTAPDAPPDPDREIEWIVRGKGVWPEGLLPAAKRYVAELSILDKMDLYPPEVATTADGTTWAVFTAGPADLVGYDSITVVMKCPPGSGWVGVNAGTGVWRSEVLPPELLETDFGKDSGLEDQ